MGSPNVSILGLLNVFKNSSDRNNCFKKFVQGQRGRGGRVVDRVGGPRTFCIRDVFILFSLLILSHCEKEQPGGMSALRERGTSRGRTRRGAAAEAGRARAPPADGTWGGRTLPAGPRGSGGPARGSWCFFHIGQHPTAWKYLAAPQELPDEVGLLGGNPSLGTPPAFSQGQQGDQLVQDAQVHIPHLVLTP